MATRIFQRGNFIVLDKNGNETIIPIDSFDYAFTTPTSVQLKDTQEGTSTSESLSLLQNETGTPLGAISVVNSYFATFKKSSTTTAPVGGSTSSNQDILNEQTQAKHIGYILDLPNDDGGFWVQFPFQYVELQINIDGVAKSFAGASQSLVDTTELAKALNNSQSLVYFGALNDTQLYFMPVFDTVVEINSIGIYQGNSGNLLEYNSFPKTSNLPTGAVHQLVTLIEQQQQILKGIKEPLETTFSLSYSGNPVRNVTQDTDEDGKLAPQNRVADIIVCAINNNVYFAFNSETILNSPTNKYPKIRNREMYLKNVDLNTFRIGGSAGASRYSLIINLKK